MTLLERIKTTAREKKNISITSLEQALGYSNGSLAKAKDIPSSRVMEIADYLDVSVDYLMTGGKREVIIETAKLDDSISNASDRLKEYFAKLAKLPKEKQDFIMQSIDMLGEKE